jgi:hypothetical protein
VARTRAFVRLLADASHRLSNNLATPKFRASNANKMQPSRSHDIKCWETFPSSGHYTYWGQSGAVQTLQKSSKILQNTTKTYIAFKKTRIHNYSLQYIYLTNISTEYFKHAHTPFSSSKCRLFHNATFFDSCIIHILHTECAKI